MPAGQMGGVPQPAGVRVEGAGGAHHHAPQIGPHQSGGLRGAVQGVGHLPDHAGAASAGGREAELADGASGDVRDGGPDALRVHIDPGGVAGRGVDRVELRARSGSPLAGAGGHHKTGGLQPRQQLGGGRLGEPGQLADLRAGERSVFEQQVEGGAVVHRPQHAGVPGVVPPAMSYVPAPRAAVRSALSGVHAGNALPERTAGNGNALPGSTVRKVSNSLEGT